MAEVGDEFCKTSEIKEILYKVLVVGNFGVGESCISGEERNGGHSHIVSLLSVYCQCILSMLAAC